MIYTSYFAITHHLPRNIEAVSIAQWPPREWKGERFRYLVPPRDLILDMKRGTISHEEYIRRYIRDVLNELDPNKIAAYFQNKCMMCFERPEDFCHRHLVWRWLLENGYDCEEWQYAGSTDNWGVCWP